ncbi:MAG TPA: hypothetical protein VEI26_12245 [Terriglobales bacterium]|nr:hypothetical protein [Terriglobales bacterium]
MRKRSRKARKTVNKPASEKLATRSPGKTQATAVSKGLRADKPHQRLAEKIRHHRITDPLLLELEKVFRELQIRAASPHSFLGVLRDIKKRGRHRDIAKWEIWTEGAGLRMENPRIWSWQKLTRKLDPEGYAVNAQKATDRMRQGIEAVQQKMEKPN